MAHHPNDRDKGLLESARASLIMLCFGLGVLAFLVAIQRPHWFRIRPVSGTAAAMAYATDTAPSVSVDAPAGPYPR